VLDPSALRVCRAVERRTLVLVLSACLISAGVGVMLGRFPSRLSSPSPYPMLPTTFSFWDRTRARHHVGLAFNRPGDIERGRAYQNLSIVWLAALYLCLKPLLLLGVPYATGQNFVVLVTFLVMAWQLGAAIGERSPPRSNEAMA